MDKTTNNEGLYLVLWAKKKFKFQQNKRKSWGQQYCVYIKDFENVMAII